ncbi:tRNA preQ1(34) S-adenosylmethionine ribosyltransferase-isomerase QueA [Paroceanicella profunda]|uniref:S-adenosylmethionine:tRNA ribosyltransferase-isomerase n=1 Tax=Paroceanicella profunda TaxID=2579971 RepID=A0A5B8FW04_9RHOB|nr:tRNA preQ1(34) S-adenosylmethionine ribosyltransferase-isomerase QueA [Paroceanicella profunda]QDL92625.1 tRNA preQ1(34) S-adenosylmethionine ribosyltransferase-isomerase QueA [Paroceanicella profunda]
MKLADFDFELPEEHIALRPARPRSSARLLVARGRDITDSTVADLPDWLRPGDMLVFNDTRVIPARLFGERLRESADGPGLARIEATLIRRIDAARWEALARPGKRLRAGDRLRFGTLGATLESRGAAGSVTLCFDIAGPELDAAIALAGQMPLPPYIAARRPADEQDRTDYQTVFAERDGAVAAPTASLHFDDALLERLAARGVLSTRVTLHVGAGTFLPVSVEDVSEHRMHSEWGNVSGQAAADIRAAKAAGGRIIPVGTTALRLIETAAAGGAIAPWSGDTDIFITPGHVFRVADGLMTNFHLPRSTLMMLVSALMGMEEIRRIYGHAIASGYRFYSYGDSSLLLPDR